MKDSPKATAEGKAEVNRELLNVIDGTARPARAGQWSELVDPSTGEVCGRAALSRAADVEEAFASSLAAAQTWNRTTPGHRHRLLEHLAAQVAARADEFIDAECVDTGKPRTRLRDHEIRSAVEDIRYFAAAARSLEGRASGEYMTGHTSVIRREPIGVVGQIGPWNYPLIMAAWKIGPALAAGNTSVFKPAETTPSSAVLLAEIAAEVLGPGVLNVVTGDRETGQAIVESAVPGLVALTGSVRAGREVAVGAGAKLTRVHLELGGKAPAIVAPDADLGSHVPAMVLAAYFNAGQDCTAATRFIVHASRYDEFVEMFTNVATRLRVGAPSEPKVYYGPLNNAAHLERVEGFLDRLPPHATVLLGGKRVDRPGFFFPPTVVVDVRQDDEIVQDEVFGPVVTVQSYRDDEEALALANGTAYGLAASIWTDSLKTASFYTRELDSGCVWVNCHLPTVPEMPHGGFKDSGYGKDLSIYSLEEYTRIKHVMTFADDPYIRIHEDGSVVM
ncbi:aldehyde dehydrogenase family protein [Catenulispora rubra]|uniref:aldehyde dehydrogenase family protein n=1 Tax=Catenulispora rubra TaxID=280293 RepID=UPI001E3ECDD9|nr:aldehyde dehydrogenase family protein [Catenulispora rubra]